jgi:trigger factor
MKVDIEEINSTKRALRIELPPQSLLDKLEAAYRHLAKEVRLPGFRPGKVPRDVLRLRFKERAKEDALRELIPESYTRALKDANLHPGRKLSDSGIIPGNWGKVESGWLVQPL